MKIPQLKIEQLHLESIDFVPNELQIEGRKSGPCREHGDEDGAAGGGPIIWP